MLASAYDWEVPPWAVRELVGARAEDLVLLVAAPGRPPGHPDAVPPAQPAVKLHDVAVYTAAGALRLFAGQKYAARHGLLRPDDYRFLWVTQFPMFEFEMPGTMDDLRSLEVNLLSEAGFFRSVLDFLELFCIPFQCSQFKHHIFLQ